MLSYNFLIRTAAVITIALLTCSPQAHARQELESSDKLAYLNSATGNTAIQDPYQRRVDAIMEINPDPNRTYVADQDAENRFEAKVEADEEEAARLALVDPVTPKPKNQGTKVETMIEPDPASQGPDNNRQDGRNKTFEQTTAKIYEDDDKKKTETALLAAQNKTAENQTAEKISKLPPSLANNPFYNAPISEDTSGEQEGFEMNRQLIVSRLVQSSNMSFEDAQKMVNSSSSREELIITIMQEQGLTYGASREVTET